MVDDPTFDDVDEKMTQRQAKHFAKSVESLRRSARAFARDRVRAQGYNPRAIAVALLVTSTEIQIKERGKEEAIAYIRAFARSIEDGDLNFMLQPDLKAKLQ